MRSFSRINAEIHSCLDRIESGAPAIAQLADTLNHLRSDPCWTDHEIREVEFVVRRIVSNLVTADED
jgi:hypothetical protein